MTIMWWLIVSSRKNASIRDHFLGGNWTCNADFRASITGIWVQLITSQPRGSAQSSQNNSWTRYRAFQLYLPLLTKENWAGPLTLAVITAVVKGFFNGFLPVPQWLFRSKTERLWIKTPDVPRPLGDLQPLRTQVGARVGALDDGVLAGIVQDRALGERNVCRDASDGYPARRNEKYAWHEAEGPTCSAAR